MIRAVLPFDREIISEDEIKEHILWYYYTAEHGKDMLKENNKRKALEILREINSNLDKENKYYRKSKVQNIMWDNNLYNEYYHALSETSSKQKSKNSYDALSSNFYDIKSYITNHSKFLDYIDEQD